ncbi:MAG TPA: glycosyltransferase family 2 protein [Candidatus Nanoarchaeia archaeon]|nr:glycosyltransferase family 2 protein [Candidatus Nanoarchaeia archaeon]
MDVIMAIGIVVFFILFLFLLLVAITILISLFRKISYSAYTTPISIVIPAYNEEKTIRPCIEAVLTAHYPKKEIIVVDDGSTDATREIAKSFPGVKILQRNHHGKVEALNAGLRAASNEIVVTLDADTIIHPDCLVHIVAPLQEKDVAATSGSCRVSNKKNILTVFQNLEYHYNNLVRQGFSNLFHQGIWFFGALACYKKSVLLHIGGFKKETLTEDADVALELNREGYRTINVPEAYGYTNVPETFAGLYAQRKRWWKGVLQSLQKNKSSFSLKSSPSIIFLYLNQYWWSLYAFLSLPIIIYQIHYWFPQGSVEAFAYLVRWFTVAGPLYVLYKLPEWGLSWYNIFGVLSGLISIAILLYAPHFFRERFSASNIIGVVFYFPYTIFLNAVICLSIINPIKKKYFIK